MHCYSKSTRLLIHLVGAHDGQVGHAHHLALALALDDRELGDHIVVITEHLADLPWTCI